ncbi:hypothetical protein PRIPAC_96327 [Pristionchus pacificus]|uniref:Adipose-secreted signaling protein n=1 Tax=Pristionchus pacificus TaxID=54126 RepID=A0A2A6BK58_PRIPA|nr:hypothetical protein PRIPAC_96327 [Pristionchus pacificus]|eukprot:PDM66267.1 hypothetical protein PRIPAC_45492 [Pristionchus pacificus]
MSHVRFGEVTDRTELHVEPTADNEFFVNLGFLQASLPPKFAIETDLCLDPIRGDGRIVDFVIWVPNIAMVIVIYVEDQHIYAIHLPLPVMTTTLERNLVSPQGDLPVESVTVKTKEEKTELELEVKLDGVHGQVQSRVTLDNISPKIVLVLRASVLKSHDGTPSLKSGISIVARLDNDDSSSVASGAPVPCK